MNSVIAFFVTLCVANQLVALSWAIGCRDPSGKLVDWFAAYKMPKIKDTEWSNLDTGAAIIYQDSKNPGVWRRIDKLMNDTKNPIARSIARIYKGKSNTLFGLYSDQPPPDRKGRYGSAHAKGLIMFTTRTGIWLIHSIPGFPSRPNHEKVYEYPNSGTKNGQSILCLSLKTSQLEKIGKQLYYDRVQFYDSHSVDKILKNRPYLNLAMDFSSKRPPAPYYSKVDIRTKAGAIFTSFAKDKKFKQDLYADYVAPELQTGFFMEGWRGGRGNMPSNCTVEYQVMNVLKIQFDAPVELDQTIGFTTSKDHSKWAVSLDKNKPYTCIGDINRQYGQYKRGGGTVCHSDLDM